jgi:deoxyribonuclease-4
MTIGAHVSCSGGLANAIKKGKEIGAEALQIFVSAPQSYRVNHYSDEDIYDFKKAFVENNFRSLFFHGIYLINLASENEFLYQNSISSLIHYLQMGEKLGAIGTIFHTGSYGSEKTREKERKVIKGIKEILDQTPANQFLIIENNAGGGGRIGVTIEELYRIHKEVNNDRLKFCIDTQHLFASGVDVSNYKIFNEWINKFNEKIGLGHIICIHANDSKTELGSNKDRHENIGEGQIGKKGFKNILRQSLLQDIPFVLEVPGENRKGPDKKNIATLRSLCYFNNKEL